MKYQVKKKQKKNPPSLIEKMVNTKKMINTSHSVKLISDIFILHVSVDLTV